MNKKISKILLISISFILLFSFSNKVFAYTFSRLLNTGMTGDDVSALQISLGVENTGKYDTATKDAVIKFQSGKKLYADGVAGEDTLSAIQGSIVTFKNPSNNSTECTGDYCYTWLGDNILVDPNNTVNTSSSIANLLGTVYRFGIAASVLLALIMMIWAGIEYMTSDAWYNKKDAIGKINNTLMGLGLALISYVMLYIINPCLVDFFSAKECSEKNSFLSPSSLPSSSPSDTEPAASSANSPSSQPTFTTNITMGNGELTPPTIEFTDHPNKKTYSYVGDNRWRFPDGTTQTAPDSITRFLAFKDARVDDLKVAMSLYDTIIKKPGYSGSTGTIIIPQ